MKKIFFLISCIISIILSVAFSGCTYAFYNFKKLNFIELKDTESKILWRAVEGYQGGGYITVNDKKVDAQFETRFNSSVRITVRKKDIGSTEIRGYGSHEDYALDFISFHDLNKNNELVSVDDDVSIFGEYYGKIVLKCTQVDKSTFDASEYTRGWKAQGDIKFSLTDSEYVYLNKLFWLTTEIDGAEKDYVLQWQADKKFSIYEYNTYEEPMGELLACGTYVNVENKATLTFVEDNLFNFKYPTLELVAEFYNKF